LTCIISQSRVIALLHEDTDTSIQFWTVVLINTK